MPRPRKTVTFKGQRFTIANISKFDRHSTRYAITDHTKADALELTPGGKRQARRKGYALPKDMLLRVYTSPLVRAVQTGKETREGHLEGGGVASRFMSDSGKVRRNRKYISTAVTKDIAKATKIYHKMGPEKAIRYWLDGKMDARIAHPANYVADRIIRMRFGSLARAQRSKNVRGVLALDISHDFIIQAVVERLLGVHFGTQGFGVPKPNQGLTVYHTKEGRVIAEYSRKRFDVTERFNKILARQLP